jgi:hypothetical protein
MASIFMVSGNDMNPGHEVIFGFYPTRELAEKRKAVVEADPNWIDEDNSEDLMVTIDEIKDVGAEGVDLSIGLR